MSAKTSGIMRGTVLWFDDKKGYGFIRPAQGELVETGRHAEPSKVADIFVHYTNISSKARRRLLLPEQCVEFEAIQDAKGIQAVNVCVVREVADAN